ncbi:MAG: sulfotransferase [Bacteroidota bacterium]
MEKKRIFIVGIARSGTTLLQSIIGNHREVATFPESHFFDRSLPKQKWLRAIHKLKPQHNDLIRSFLADIQLPDIYEPYKGDPRDLNAWCQYIISVYDSIAEHSKKSTWLEKTPLHLHYTDLIEKNTKNVHFLHMVREPIANIAAIYQVSKQHPGSFNQSTIKKATQRYLREIKITDANIKKNNHHLVRYENIVEAPRETIEQVCEQLGLSYSDNLLNFQKTAKDVQQSDESWKQNNTNTIRKQNKIDDRMTEAEQKYVKSQLKRLNTKILDFYND